MKKDLNSFENLNLQSNEKNYIEENMKEKHIVMDFDQL
jgi:hypothetical protein